jgi:phospholipase/lecithinase/hemolysin
MAPFSRLLLVALLLVAVTGGSGTNYGEAHYDRVFSFGDSLTDTGNSAILPATAGGPFTNTPYGETYFKRPSGRASDGRLVIDFIGINHSTSNHQFSFRFICVDLHS